MPNLGEIIVISAPISIRLSVSMPFICTFSFVLSSFVAVCQNTSFLVSPKIFLLATETVLS